MPSLDLISMNEENPLLCLIEKRMEMWNDSDDDSVLSETSCDSSVSSKKRRLSNDLYPLEDSPATAALEQFLSFSVDETAFLDPLDAPKALVPLKPFSINISMSKSKAIPSLSDLTRGLAQISH